VFACYSFGLIGPFRRSSAAKGAPNPDQQQLYLWRRSHLAQVTADPNNSLNSILCPGTDSPAGCGSNSKYTVVYRIINNNSLITVPDLLGESPGAATVLAQQAGLGISIIREPTGPRNQRPTVENQFPDPGSRVPPGSSVQAFVIVPSPTGVPL
jgi:PASTA domain-containing protein